MGFTSVVGKNHGRQNDFQKFGHNYWIIGGMEMYCLFLPHCMQVICSEIFALHEGDTFFTMPPYFFRHTKIYECDQFQTYLWRRE
jgi:dihydrofolate reductase